MTDYLPYLVATAYFFAMLGYAMRMYDEIGPHPSRLDKTFGVMIVLVCATFWPLIWCYRLGIDTAAVEE